MVISFITQAPGSIRFFLTNKISLKESVGGEGRNNIEFIVAVKSVSKRYQENEQKQFKGAKSDQRVKPKITC